MFAKNHTVLGFVAILATPALALPFPVNSNIAGFKHADLLVLVDNDDMTRPDFAIGNYKAVHILPRRIELFRDPETGKADFSTLPTFDRNGKLSNLILDFSVVTSTGGGESNLALTWPSIAMRYYPIAKLSTFEGTTATPHAKILTLMSENEEDTPIPANYVLSAIGQAEPLRVELSKEGLNQYRCAIDAFELAEAEAEALGKSLEFPSKLSLVTGRLVQQYRTMDYEAKLIGVNSPTDFKHSIALSAKVDVTDSARELDGLIAEAIKFYKPSCDWNNNKRPEEQITLGGFNEFMLLISQNGILFKVKL